MAGLCELWSNPELPDEHPDKWLWTITVLTAPALLESFVDHWLDLDPTDRDDVQALVNSIPEPHLIPHEVSTAVNSVRNSSLDLLDLVRADRRRLRVLTRRTRSRSSPTSSVSGTFSILAASDFTNGTG